MPGLFQHIRMIRVVFVPYFFAAVSIVFSWIEQQVLILQKNSAFSQNAVLCSKKYYWVFAVVILVLGAVL